MSSKDIALMQRALARKALAKPQHRFDDLYYLLCRKDWIEAALDRVLNNKGSRTAGIDSVTRHNVKEDRAGFVERLRNDLKQGTYQPSPVRRVWIPKPGNKEKRPLGIPTLRDRVVQQMLRMIMEPIWESDFLPCSHGFRIGHSTWDCIRPMYDHINSTNKYYWVIEGDIRKCFDRINHQILLRLIRRRIKDEKIIRLIQAFLQAGVMDGGLFIDTPEGTPQGGILSPLLANIYLHELDKWLWYGIGPGLSKNERRRRRYKPKKRARMKRTGKIDCGHGNAIPLRYADDFVVLWNGTKEEAVRLKEQIATFLRDELALELSEEKTRITHVDDGFDFLGFHIQRRIVNGHARVWVTPSDRSVARVKKKIKAITSSNRTLVADWQMIGAVNAVVRGWANYYLKCRSTEVRHKLDWYVGDRVYRWLRKKHQKKGYKWITRKYRQRQCTLGHNRWNWVATKPDGKQIWRFMASDLKAQRSRSRSWRSYTNPYLDIEVSPEPLTEAETPFPKVWEGVWSTEKAKREELRRKVMERDGHQCVRCGSTEELTVHHKKALKDGGSDSLANLVTLCRKCHTQTKNYGRKRA